jgi:hypothetical protein
VATGKSAPPPPGPRGRGALTSVRVRGASGWAILNELTGSANAAYQALGNSLQVAMVHYIKPSIKDGLAGLRLLEAATQSK